MIDIAMTATIRPDIVEKTLFSIRKNLQYSGELNLVVDIAPIGDDKYTQQDVLKAIHWFFPKAKTRVLQDSLQAEALTWTWRNCSSEFILQWEDDWALTQFVDLDLLISKFPPLVGSIVFDRAEKLAKHYPGYKGQYFPIDSTFMTRVVGKSLGGPPALMRRAYVEDVLRIVDNRTCLDLLSRTEPAKALLRKWGVYCYLGEDGAGGLVRDLGKAWRAERNIIMKKDTERGVTWIQK